MEKSFNRKLKTKDTGADPLPDGTFRMYPSGDVVNFEERNRRLPLNNTRVTNDCLNRSWAQIEQMQGGKLKRRIK